MSSPTPTIHPPARTHAEAAALFRRPFAPGAIGFRAMTKVAYNGPLDANTFDQDSVTIKLKK